MVNELKDVDIVKESNSEYANPILFMKKKTVDVRMFVNYSAANKMTK